MAASSDDFVLVTGASGFVATHVIQQLQQAGYRVRGTVRSTKNEAKVKPLRNLCPGAKHEVELVEADLTNADSWPNAVRGCNYVIHVASPFPPGIPKDKNEVIKPAVDGTLNVLRACQQVGGVKRVVLTSSMVAVSGGIDMGQDDKVYTEADWTDLERPKTQPYIKSKALAEKAAWDFIKGLPDGETLELAVMNPGYIMGPVLCGSFTTSMELPQRLMQKEMPMLPNVSFAVIDVRDVAKAHIVAMKLPEAANNRHILMSKTDVWVKDIAVILEKEFKDQGYKVPTCVSPDFALKIGSHFSGPLKQIAPGLGKVTKLDNTRMRTVLGIDPIKVEDIIKDMTYSMIDNGMIKKSDKYKGRK